MCKQKFSGISFLIAITISFSGLADQPFQIQKRIKINPIITSFSNPTDSVYEYPTQMPKFPGGKAALVQFFLENLKYPDAAMAKNVEGMVIVSFIVEKDGSISNVKIKRGVAKLINEEAVRLVKLMPNFEPGKNKGKTVRTKSMIPITFKLSN